MDERQVVNADGLIVKVIIRVWSRKGSEIHREARPVQDGTRLRAVHPARRVNRGEITELMKGMSGRIIRLIGSQTMNGRGAFCMLGDGE
jgi:hypothetical protein